MNKLDNMPLDQAIELYFAKHVALRDGDLTKLIAMRHEHPEIFKRNWVASNTKTSSFA